MAKENCYVKKVTELKKKIENHRAYLRKEMEESTEELAKTLYSAKIDTLDCVLVELKNTMTLKEEL